MRAVRPVLSQPKHSNFISAWGIVMTAILLALASAARAGTRFDRSRAGNYTLPAGDCARAAQ